MINPKELRKTKIMCKKNEEVLTPTFFENLEKTAEDKNLKNFFRGCKHILERHFAEAIKWFQLVDDDDAILMILLCAYKLGDKFLFSEYYRENFEGSIFKNLGIDIYLQKENRIVKVNNEVLKKLKEELED